MERMSFGHDFDGSVGRVEDVTTSAVPPIEAPRVTPVQPVDRRSEHLFLERAEQVIVRRHEAEAVAAHELLCRELREDLDACVVVAVATEDVFFSDRASGDVEQAGVLGTHRASLPGHPSPIATT
jgi:hypothetical protein